jgi:hypothetical protein
MRQAFILLFLWALAAPSWAVDKAYASQSAANTAAQAMGGCITQGTAGDANCGGSSSPAGGCYFRKGAGCGGGITDRFSYYSGGGCPAGTQNIGGFCQSGASAGQKAAASTSASSSAAADGFDSLAQAAAGSKAEAILDAWILAGKPLAEAQAAAQSAAAMAAVENVYSRHSALQSTMVSTCIASGANSSACSSAESAYYSAMSASGVDATRGVIFEVETQDGRNVSYQSSASGWQVFEVDATGRVSRWIGDFPTIDFSPSVTAEPSFGVATPGAVNAANGEPVRDPAKSPLVILEQNASAVEVLSIAAQSVSFLSATTGASTGSVTKLADGSFVSTGTVPSGATSQLSKALQEFAGAGGSGAVTGTAGGSSGGSVSGAVDIVDGSGAGAYSAVTSGIDSAKNAFLGLFSGSGSATLAHGWDWGIPSLSLPSVSCSAWNISSGGWTLPIDPCPVAEKIRDIGGFVLYVLTVFGLFRILTGRTD